MNSRERIRIFKEDRKGSLNANQVLRRLSVLCEGRQYLEAAHLVNRLGSSALCVVATEMPLDLLAEALPYSSTLLECLFTKLNGLLIGSKPNVHVDRIIWHLVKLFGSPCDYSLIRRCEKLIGLIGIWKPEMKAMLKEREGSFESAIQGLGLHGLTHITNENGKFISLRSALRRELQFHIDTYKLAINVIDETETSADSDPAQASHQRLLAFKYDDIQKRLIDNKILLTKLEVPGLKQLHNLLDNLRERVEKDKEVLICVNQVKNRDRDVDLKEWPAAKVIMDFSRGCKSVMSLMNNEDSSESVEDAGSASDGYHSETESDERKILIEEYHALYKSSRIETLKALNESQQIEIAESVKLKILFSVVVLAFRSCHSLKEKKLLEVRRTLNVLDRPGNFNDAIISLETSVKNFLLSTCEAFPLEDVEISVANQIYTTLHGYSCINQLLIILKHFIKKSVRLAWKLCNQPSPFYLDTDFTLSTINLKKHARSSTSNQKSTIIQYFLWPALFRSNECLSKAVVVT
ncbi:CLUMA_CG005657, isoform A [Clunio marinus]|uniref:Mitochondria-eating protein n=1 Tax=Clunio marinus TaxID=568069 RepID=A0A1J1HX41_9DIPT|nr:CLUMA_CG005657, isoform A [Clunio marinus]